MKLLIYILLMITNSQTIIDNASIETVGQRTIANFRPKNKAATRFTGVCPHCNDDNKRLDINPKKNFYFCGHCKTGGNVFQLYAASNNLDTKTNFADIIYALADITQQTVETDKPQSIKRKNPISTANEKTFCQIQLSESGLTVDDVTIQLKPNEGEERTIVRFIAGSLDETNAEAPGDDMLIRYVNLDRTYSTYYPISSTGKATTKQKIFTRVRYQFPEHHLDKNGKPIKYKSPPKSGTFIYLPNAIISAYEQKKQIHTLFIQEGEKKAEKATKHGILSVGIQGISMLGANEQLHPDLIRIVKQCDVKNVVFVLDANMFTLPDEGQNIEKRAVNAYRSVEKFKYYFKALEVSGIEVATYFSFIQPEHGEKGIDDLLVSIAGDEDKLAEDFTTAITTQPSGKGKYVICKEITEISAQKLKELFHLESREAFIHHHKTELLQRGVFLYQGTKYTINESGEAELAQPLSEQEIFWKLTNTNRVSSYTFIYEKYNTFLNNNHIGRYLPDSDINNDYEIVELNPVNRTVRKINYQYLVDFTYDTIRKMGMPDLLNWLQGSEKTLNERTINNIFKIDFQFIPKVHDTEFMFFQNGFWRINAEGATEHLLHEANGFVWEKKLKPHNPKLLPQPLVQFIQDDNGNFIPQYSPLAKECQFLQYLIDSGDFHFNARGGRSIEETNPEYIAEINTHLANKLSCLGYLAHSYFSPSKAKAIVAMDGVEREAGETQGRTGKSSIVGESLNQIKDLAYIDAKKPRINEDKYIFSVVTHSTEVVLLDDLKRNFDLELLFNAILGHLAVRQMHKTEVYINKENTPKFYIPTNYGIDLEKGDSVADRFHFMVFSPYYNKDFKPTHKFGNEFYKEWDDHQYNLFFNLYTCAIQTYFKYGLIDAPGNRPQLIAYRQRVGEDFIAWAESYFTPDKFGTEIEKKEAFDDFLKNYVTNKTFAPSARKLKEKLRDWCEMNNLILNPNVQWISAGKVKAPHGGDIKTNGVEYIKIIEQQHIDTAMQQTVEASQPDTTTTTLIVAKPTDIIPDDEPF